MSRTQLYLQGLRDSVPMLVGIAPFGIIFGTLAGVAGLSLWQAVACRCSSKQAPRNSL